MAANFGIETTGVGGIASSATPKQIAAEEPVAIQGLTDIFKGVRTHLKGFKETKNQSVLSNFMRDQLLIADALDQGSGKVRNSAHAKTLWRQNLLNARDAHPNLGPEFLKIQNQLEGISGAGKIVGEGSKEEQRQEKSKDQLVSLGLAPSNASEDQFAQAEQRRVEAQAAAEKFKQKKLEIDERVLDATEKTRLEAAAANEFATSMFPAEHTRMGVTYDAILAGEGTSAEKIEAMRAAHHQLVADSAQVFGSIKSASKDVYEGLFNSQLKLFEDRASGELSLETLKRENELIMASAENLALQNPEMVAAALLKKVFGDGALLKVIVKNPDSQMVKYLLEFAAGGDPNNTIDQPSAFTINKSQKKAAAEYQKLLSQQLTSSDPEIRKAALEDTKTYLENLQDDTGKIVRSPAKGTEVASWVGSSGFLRALKANPDLLEGSEELTNAMEAHYFDEVRGMIAKEFANNMVFTASETPGEGWRSPTFSGNITPTPEAIEAVATEGGMTFRAIDSSNRAAVLEASRLNKELKPIINTTVRASGHLADGGPNENYKEIWEKMGEDILTGGQGTGEVAGGDAGDDLTMGDFIYPQAQIKDLPKEVAEDDEFLSAVEELAAKHEIDPSVLLAVMDFETGGTFNPAQKNAAGSSGTGLIQFMKATAKGLGTSTEDLSEMTRLEQMKWVEKYFDQHAGKIRGGDASDVYMSVLYPKAAGKSDDYVLFREGTTAYKQNAGLDKSGDGTVTKKEAAAKVVALVSKYKKGK